MYVALRRGACLSCHAAGVFTCQNTTQVDICETWTCPGRKEGGIHNTVFHSLKEYIINSMPPTFIFISLLVLSSGCLFVSRWFKGTGHQPAARLAEHPAGCSFLWQQRKGELGWRWRIKGSREAARVMAQPLRAFRWTQDRKYCLCCLYLGHQ